MTTERMPGRPAPKTIRSPLGYVLRGLVTTILVADAGACFSGSPWVAQDLAGLGIPPILLPVLGATMLACALLYALPRTGFAGAILITGLLGGAILTHLRLAEFGTAPEIFCVLMGIATWGGLWLTDRRVKALLLEGPA